MVFKLPLDAYVLLVPIAYASVAFVTMAARIHTKDPETSTAKYYEDEAASARAAQRYDNQFKQIFEARIRNRQMGVLAPGSPQ